MKKMIASLIGLFLSLQHSTALDFVDSENFVIECDNVDPLRSLRQNFLIPKNPDGSSQIYLCGHSLGLQPKRTQEIMQTELDAWANLGVEGHFKSEAPWYTYHELVRNSLANIVGARPEEVVAMNSLTANLHLMMVSFYMPSPSRHKVLMESPVFSSDTYAVKSQIIFHGFDPNESLIIIEPRQGEDCLRLEDIDKVLDERGEEIALVLLSAVNYFNGQKFDLHHITKKAHEHGCLVGFDLAHAIGNVPLDLHDADADFAAWCSYKYLNAGPGAIGGAFVHERHLDNHALNRFAGWWGNDPQTRFQLHLQPDFVPVARADSWQQSNPSIFSLVPLRASLEIFDQVGMSKIREKSLLLTGYLEFLIQQIHSDQIEIITPKDPLERGCMLSIKVNNNPALLMEKLHQEGIICDFRRPNVLRITPIPLYNTFYEVWKFGQILKNHLNNDSVEIL